jgi:hypothetical protein
MPQVQDVEETPRSRRGDILVSGLYAAVIGANLYLAFDWWRETPSGAATMERWQQKADALKIRAQECEGCAKRKAVLKGAINRMHWDAERIVEGQDVPTVPEA